MTTILLIDDDPHVLTVHEALLRDFGYEVISKDDTVSALTLIGNGMPIDLIITDFCMPVMNGVELIRAFRQTLPSVPVLMLTGYSDVEIDPDLGVFACINKPVKDRELDRSIKAALDHADMRNLLLTAY